MGQNRRDDLAHYDLYAEELVIAQALKYRAFEGLKGKPEENADNYITRQL